MKEIASFTTDPEICPYLHDRPSRQSVRMVADLSTREYSRVLSEGWRRFGRLLFRPTCWHCSECIPIRVVLESFSPSKSQRRVLRKNDDVEVEIGRPIADRERLDLYRKFHKERAVSRGWPYREMPPSEYYDTFVDNSAPTLEFSYRIEGRLVGVAYVGDSAEAFNSIYAFTDPEESRRSLGTLDVLEEIKEAQRRGLKYLYLGFFVERCGSMSYKAGFRPFELRVGGRWQAAENRRPTDD